MSSHFGAITISCCLLLCVCLAHCEHCDNKAPGNCSCDGVSPCNWTYEGWDVKHDDHRTPSSYVQLVQKTGSIESGRICSTDSSMHCLKFQYFIRKKVTYTSTFLTVQLQLQRRVVKLWEKEADTSHDWKEVQIPIHVTSDFKIIIEGRKVHLYTIDLYISDIRYIQSPCTLSSLKTTPPNHISQAAKLNVPTTAVTSLKKCTDESTSPVNMAESTPASDKSTQSSTAIIAGATAAGLLVVGITILLFFLHRRRKLQAGKNHRQKEKKLRSTSWHNEAYELDGEDRNTAPDKDLRPTAIQSIACHQNSTRTSSELDKDDYSEIQICDEEPPTRKPLASWCSEASNQNGVAETQQSQSSRDSSLYSEIEDGREAAAASPDNTYPRSIHGKTRINGTGIAVIVSSSQAHEQVADEYNHLTTDPSSINAPEPIHILLGNASQGQNTQIQAKLRPVCKEGALTKSDQQAAGMCYVREEDQSVTAYEQSTSTYHVLKAGSSLDIHGLYHVPEEFPSADEHEQSTSVYHVIEADTSADITEIQGMYHVLEENPSTQSQEHDSSEFHVPENQGPTTKDKTGRQYYNMEEVRSETRPGNMSEGAYDYKTLDGRSSFEKKEAEGTLHVYGHLNEGSDDTYCETDRTKKTTVIDDEYSHIQQDHE